MRVPGQCSTRHRTIPPSARQQRGRRELTWIVFGVAGLALAACGSDASENGSAASGGGDSDVTADGELDGESSDELAEARAELEELQESADFGSGSGTITVGDVDYSFDANVCYSQDTGFEATGPGQTADGVPYWASVVTGVSTRQAMLASGLPEESVDTFFGDKDSIESFGARIEMGKAEQFGSGDDAMPDLRIDALDATESDGLNYSVDGTSISGTGALFDDNGIAFEFGEPVPFTFSASCE